MLDFEYDLTCVCSASLAALELVPVRAEAGRRGLDSVSVVWTVDALKPACPPLQRGPESFPEEAVRLLPLALLHYVCPE